DIPVGINKKLEVVSFGIVCVNTPGDAMICGENAFSTVFLKPDMNVPQVVKRTELERNLIDAGSELRIGGVAREIFRPSRGQDDLMVIQRVARQKHQVHTSGLPPVS